MTKTHKRLNTIPKKDLVKHTQISLEAKYDKKVSMETITDVINAYEEILKMRMLKGERLLTGMGIFELRKLKAHPAGMIGNLHYDAVPERFKPKLTFNNKLAREITNLRVEDVAT
jgi:nucleoid DNA-binding protein